MAYPAFDYITPNEYLNIEIRADKKHEYFDGRMYAMAGAGLNHNYVVSSLISNIGSFLKGKKCDIFVADLRITTPGSDSYMYPDLSIICDDVETQENSFDTVINPSVIIEVMSPSTKGFDMAFKLHYYKQIPSLKEYILVDSTKCFVQIYRRDTDGSWVDALNIEDMNSSLGIDTIGLQLPLNDVYRKVSFAK